MNHTGRVAGGGKVVDHPRSGQIGCCGPRSFCKQMLGGQRQSTLFADVSTRLIDDRQPIPVGVLSETYVSTMFAHRPAKLRQVLGQRFRRVRKAPRRVSVDVHDLTTEILQ